MASAALAPSSKEQIVLAAERLFAEHGIDGVSLRQIGQSAGNANNSAVQYHFGTKDNLIRAIFEYRLPYLTRRRQLLVAERCPSSLRSWVECYLTPVLEQAEYPGSWYLTFVTQLHRWDQGRLLLGRIPASARATTEEFFARLRGFLDIPEPICSNRMPARLRRPGGRTGPRRALAALRRAHARPSRRPRRLPPGARVG
jgi:AcrR family transcriptional regulator